MRLNPCPLPLSNCLVMLILLTTHLFLPVSPFAQSGVTGPQSYVLKIGWSSKDKAVKQKCLTMEIGDSTRSKFE
ncbi:MAG: hypothetical protein ABIK07_07185, partial [Planctomycetota bacterium]